MLPLLLAGGVLAFSSGMMPSYNNQNDMDGTYEKELREIHHSGALAAINSTRNIHSEETKMIRPNNASSTHPMEHAKKHITYVTKKNRLLGKLHEDNAREDDIRIIRKNYSASVPLVMLPNHEGFSQFDSLPNAYYDRESEKPPADHMFQFYKDPYGHNANAPAHEYNYMYPNILYWGNHWGPGGPSFKAVGNQYRDPDYESIKYKPKTNIRLADKFKKKVRFSNSSNKSY